jgi:hypothetical protein
MRIGRLRDMDVRQVEPCLDLIHDITDRQRSRHQSEGSAIGKHRDASPLDVNASSYRPSRTKPLDGYLPVLHFRSIRTQMVRLAERQRLRGFRRPCSGCRS